MRGMKLTELAAFMAVAEHQSFTKAAEQLGLSRPTLTQNIRSLEERLGVRLLNRTTRSVSMTEVGRFLIAQLRPAFESLNGAVEQLNSFRAKPAGSLRIVAVPMAATMVVGPVIAQFLEEYPDIDLEISTEYSPQDIVSGRFDAGIRIEEHIEKDMIAVRVSGRLRPYVVGSPTYLASHPAPETLADLPKHNCIRFRYPHGGLNRWTFVKKGRPQEVAVNGTLIVNDFHLVVRAALDGVGLGFVPPYYVGEHIAEGRLVSLLARWVPQYSGFFLYYSGRRQLPATLKALIRHLRKNAAAVPRSDRGGL
jgi:DNA-binding transcriptional LysR family regulator